jgi:glutathione S-transferase
LDRTLYQFPLSHYCEKARWVLDHKQLDYRLENQLPGAHAVINMWRTGKRTVPVLVDGGRAISGSHAIAVHVDAIGAGPSLLPKSGAARAVLDELVHFFDRQVGPAVRRYAYGFITARGDLFEALFFQGYAGPARAFGGLMAPLLRREIARMYRVHHPSNRESPELIRRAADSVEARLRDGSRYLLGDQLSLADITVASLLGPMTGSPGSPWAVELDIPELEALRAELRARPIGRYIGDLYSERHRRAGPE